ncbi:MAG: MMPL family transporter [Thermoplasmata archaeon]
MLEKQFEIFSKFVKRNALKFIIIWIVILVIFLPFSSLLFSETSYNIASSVVPSNTMSSKASNILSNEFPSTNVSSNTTVDLVLIENANVSNPAVIKTILAMQNAVDSNSTLKKYSASVSDIYTTENQLLLNFSKSTKLLFNGTYSMNKNTKFLVSSLVSIGNFSIMYMNGILVLYNNVRSGYIEILNNTNNSLPIEFGVPDYFTLVFLNAINNGYPINVSNYIAYKETISFIENNLTILQNILIPYIQNYTYFWNYSMVNPLDYKNVEESSIEMTLFNSSFSNAFSGNQMISFWKLLATYFNVTNFQNVSAIKSFAVNYVSSELSHNSTVTKMLPYGVKNFVIAISENENASYLSIEYANSLLNNTEKSFLYSFFPDNYFNIIFNKNISFVENYTIQNVAIKFSSNRTIMNFTNILYIPLNDLIKNAYKSQNITNTSANEVSFALEKTFYGNPLVNLNKNTINRFIISLNSTENVNNFVNTTIMNENFSTYPVVPSPYIFHKFVSYTGNVSLFVININQSAPISTLNIIGNISNEYIPKLNNASYLLAGENAIEEQLTNQANGGLYKALLVGIIIAIIISILYFRSPIAGLMPLMIFGFSALISLGMNGLIYKYILHAQVSFITPTLLLILLLGLTADYSVYIMSRYRKELRSGKADRAVITTQWAGHAVFTSGLTVIISYLTLWLANVPIFSDSGLTNAISISITLLIALTFLPSILAILDKKMFWPSKIENVPRHENIMGKVSQFDKSYKKLLMVIFIIITLGSLFVYATTPAGMDVFQLIPHESGLDAVQVINQTFKGDTVFQNYILLVFPYNVVNNGTYNTNAINIINNTENYLLSTGNVSFVYGPTFPYGNYVSFSSIDQYSNTTKSIYTSQINSYIGKDNRTVVIYFQLSILSWSNKAMNFVTFLDNHINKVIPSGVEWYIGGLSQGLIDANNHTVSAFEMIVPVIAFVAFIILLVQFNSVFTPLRLVLMVLGSVIFSLVITYTIFYYIMKLPIIIFLPLFVFITLLAVGLDYDIFMITRVREEVIKGSSDEDGIETSLKENGMVIAILGLILASTFLSLSLSNLQIIQEIGVGLALGVFVDTFISWMFFIPAVMLILKSYNWWPSKIGKK